MEGCCLSGPAYRRTFRIRQSSQLLRVGSVLGFKLCPESRESGGQCNQPFDALHVGDSLCPSHSVRKISKEQMGLSTRLNLQCEGVFFSSIPTSDGKHIEVVRRPGCDIDFRSSSEGTQVRVQRKKYTPKTSSMGMVQFDLSSFVLNVDRQS